jgi:hypothetical protein
MTLRSVTGTISCGQRFNPKLKRVDTFAPLGHTDALDFYV